jgi:hypothetical protein
MTVEDAATIISVYTDSIVENFGAASVEAAVVNLLVSITENLSANDIRTIQAGFNVAVAENTVLADSFGVGGWVKIISTQNADWVDITSSQNPGWAGIDDSQNPNWQNINNPQ